jgi:OFA family oxalate/formate antiporter-like MFS transporter
MAAVAALLALFVLKPMRRAYVLQHAEPSLEMPYESTRISESARISAGGS